MVFAKVGVRSRRELLTLLMGTAWGEDVPAAVPV